MRSLRTLCLIASRNLGDITIVSSNFRRLAAQRVADRYVVWTRPGMAFLFDGIPDCIVVESNFPVGTNKGFNRKTVGRFFRAAWRIRRLRPTWTVDYVGDFRERFFARLVGSRSRLHIGWGAGHAHREIIRNPFGDGSPTYVVPAEVPNVYAGFAAFTDFLVDALGDGHALASAEPAAQAARTLRVGLHPFASQDCRKWPAASWTALATRLMSAGVELAAFGAIEERAALEAMFSGFGESVRIVTRSLADFSEEVSRLDVMVGLDSFSIHIAERAGVHSVLINGANDPTLFAPPHAAVLKSSGGCVAWPCYNRPKCIASSAEYVCIRSIDVDRVYAAISAQLEQAGGRPLARLERNTT